jgi:hypothetical protein
MDTIRCILTRKLYYPKKIQVPSRKKYTVREFVEFVWFFESQSQRVLHYRGRESMNITVTWICKPAVAMMEDTMIRKYILLRSIWIASVPQKREQPVAHFV